MSECPGGGGINVKPFYVKDSRSPGALVCAVPVDDDGPKFSDMRLVAIDENVEKNCTIPELTGGVYNVVVFDLEITSLPRKPTTIAAHSSKMRVNPSKGNFCNIYHLRSHILLYRNPQSITTK